ncbi:MULTISPECIES: DUF2913 family protein [Pectobacterium]|uniref:DUF2913 family protein n=1 Tax=Pectobacterium TaxID=122277 RepID=UPI000DD016F3|nr:DUF2913 family protein [Pectobacterium parvum]
MAEGITERRTQEIGHMAWCGLIALALARDDKRINSVTQETLFLTSWLATALKQHRFPREVAPDIQWLIKKGRTQGMQAKLAITLEYLWRSCAGEMATQSDLFRLTAAVETAKDKGWSYSLSNDREWGRPLAMEFSHDRNSIQLSRLLLDKSFDDEGNQSTPLYVYLTGNVEELKTLIEPFNWYITKAHTSGEGFYLLFVV